MLKMDSDSLTDFILKMFNIELFLVSKRYIPLIWFIFLKWIFLFKH